MYSIDVKNVVKGFRVYLDKGTSLKEKVIFKNRNKYENRRVLNDVSFCIEPGEAVGLIGKNGCGKSTLLKLISRIMYPDSGSITVNGRVSSLIELGAGFHPDMSGRENIYINASIFGLTKKEIDKRLESIISFSELEQYIDTPVRTYSSGMYMRLAFSVAINVNADILLIDEILAVGDANFQAKCFHKLREIKSEGTTIVIVSHSLQQIEQFCDRSIWIKDGEVFADGLPRDVHPAYMEYMGKSRRSPTESGAAKKTAEIKALDGSKVLEGRWGNKKIEITAVHLLDKDMKAASSYKVGEKMNIKIEYQSEEFSEKPVFGIGIFRSDGINCYGTNTLIDKENELIFEKKGTIWCVVDALNLLSGVYTLDIAAHAEDGTAYDYIKKATSFSVYSEFNEAGIVHIDHHWGCDHAVQ